MSLRYPFQNLCPSCFFLSGCVAEPAGWLLCHITWQGKGLLASLQKDQVRSNVEKGAKHVASVSYFLLEKEGASLDPT